MNYIDINLPHIIEAKEIHKDKLLPILKVRRNNCGNNDVITFLTDDILEKILINEPKKLKQIHLSFIRRVLNSSIDELLKYPKIKRKRNKSNSEQTIFNNYSSIYATLNVIFDYELFSKKTNNDYSAYDLAEKLDVPTCPYCNRIYTKTVVKPSKTTRPAFDHWYSKSDFPLLALSFYNLIPSCNVCNSSVKGADLFDLKTHFHPYSKSGKPEQQINFKFSYYHKFYSTFRFKIVNNNDFSKCSTEAFKLKEIYETHEDEITDLRRLRDVYSEKYLAMLKNNILKGTSISDEEIYRLAFGTHIDEDKFDRRPLSKMKKDILEELGILRHI
ncbi:hypothetical protein [Elizabethkingia bruuniana]|uniref:hypothetical protein n=1 Tax=Elizabethkingia bruuniana TaxID=1756149 RepID=UPI00241F2336|nr:hypothetical protein [Elizabethkingia bruuniana]